MKASIAHKVDLMVEDLKSKLHLFDNFLIWRVMKQIEYFCLNNGVAVPREIEFSIKIHELAAKQQGAFLDNWDDGMDYVSWRKSTNVANGNCMFFEPYKLTLKNLRAKQGKKDVGMAEKQKKESGAESIEAEQQEFVFTY